MAGKPKSGKTKNANKVGRPDKYRPEYAALAFNYCLLGAKNEDLARYFEVAISTISEWMKRHKEFSDTIKKGRDIADALVAKSLYKRATGYNIQEEKISSSDGQPVVLRVKKHFPPDPVSCFFWLKNRQRLTWRDKPEGNSDNEETQRQKLEELQAYIAALLNRQPAKKEE